MTSIAFDTRGKATVTYDPNETDTGRRARKYVVDNSAAFAAQERRRALLRFGVLPTEQDFVAAMHQSLARAAMLAVIDFVHSARKLGLGWTLRYQYSYAKYAIKSAVNGWKVRAFK